MIRWRSLHAGPRAPAFSGSQVVRATPLVDPKQLSKPEFKVLGFGSLLEVNLPPSIPLYTRRNQLCGVLGTNSESLVARTSVCRSFLLNLLGRQPLLWQKVESSEPATCLISGGTRNAYLTSVDLDGSRDWAVSYPNRIQATCGRGLHISARSGWRPGSAPFIHQLVTGRGLIALASPSPLVRAEVESGKSILVHRDHLGCFSLDTNASQVPPQMRSISYDYEPVQKPVPELKIPEKLAWSRPVVNFTVRTITLTYRFIKRWLRSGNSGFIEIYGPSTVLVTSSAKSEKVPTQ